MRTASVAVMLTRRCNMACTHCSVESHPKLKLQPSEEEIRQRVVALVDSGVKAFQFTGGEPLLRQPLLLEMLEIARNAGAACAVFSNGFWGKKPEVAERTFDALRAAGMTRLALSYDRFHAEFQGPEPLLNILEVAKRRDWPVRVTITRTADEHDLETLVAPFHGQSHAEVRFYDVQPVGAARNLSDKMRSELAGFCSACSQATITDDGRMIACNGPSYFESEDSPLSIGKIAAPSQVGQLLDQHGNDPILETIRVEGPLRLKEILEQLPGFENFSKSSYGGMCELCLHITRDPSARAALTSYLSSDEQRAVQVAHRRLRTQVQQEAVAGGGFNDRLGPSAIMSALIDQDPQVWARFITRPDLDWRRLAERLKDEGLLHLLAKRREDAYLNRWVPQFVWKEGEGLNAHYQERQGDLQQILQLSREAGFDVRAAGASAVFLQGGRRAPKEFSLLTSGDVQALNLYLRARLGPQVRFRLDQTAASLPDPTAELLSEWRGRLFRDALGTVWDAHELHKMGLWHVDPKSGATILAAARVLAVDFALPSPPPGESLLGRNLVEKVVRAQMFRDQRHSDNLFLGAALFCLDARSPSQLPRAIAQASLQFGRDLWSSVRSQGWRATLNRARQDARVFRLLS